MSKYLLPVVLGLVVGPAWGADTSFYAGLKLGSVSVDEEEIDDLKDSPIGVEIDDASYSAIILGYQFNPVVAVEVEIGGSEHDVEYDVPYLQNVLYLPDQELELGIFGLYVTYRSQGQWYFKARGGLLSRSVELSPELPGQDEDNAGLLSLGIGGGVRIDDFNIEAEFSSIEEGISSFGVNLLYNF